MENSTINGIVKRHPDGFGFLIPDLPDFPDLYLSRKEMVGVMTNDRISAKVIKEKGGQRFFGVDVRVIERGVRKVVGKALKQPNGDLVLYGSYEKWGAPLVIPFRNSRGATEQDIVAVEIVAYPEEGKPFTGRVVEIIGDEADPMNDIKRVIHIQEIPNVFPFAVKQEAAATPDHVRDQDRVGRVDLRDKCLITIDGTTAKDFDDAVLVERDPKGFRLWVAIADVSYYVKVDSPLDEEAYQRGTSVYLPNFVVPMLPEELSNEICSLKPNVDRLAFTCEMVLGFDGVVLDAKVYESVIRSHARVTYGEAQDILTKDANHSVASVNDNIHLATDLAKILMAKRYRDGSLDLEVPETEVVVDEFGNPIDIIKSERVFAHKLIEELMLVANTSVAKLIKDKEQQALYRVHEAPDAEDIGKLQAFLKTFGSASSLSGGSLQKKLTKSLQEFKGRNEGVILNILTLRSMSQAKYAKENVGHFGLGFEDYVHFTSPIRRYPDLIVHRILKALFTNSASGRLYDEEYLATAGTMLSACEQRAVKAERMIVSIKKARFMSDKIGETFIGMISSVAKFGVFVLLRQFDVDGLIKVDNLGFDHFEFNEEHLYLVGKKTKKIYKIGDTLEVLVSAVNVEEGQIDFILATEVQGGRTKGNKDKEGKGSQKRSLASYLKSSGKKDGKPGKSGKSNGKDRKKGKGKPGKNKGKKRPKR